MSADVHLSSPGTRSVGHSWPLDGFRYRFAWLRLTARQSEDVSLAKGTLLGGGEVKDVVEGALLLRGSMNERPEP